MNDLKIASDVLSDEIDRRAAVLVERGVAAPWRATELALEAIMRERRQRARVEESHD